MESNINQTVIEQVLQIDHNLRQFAYSLTSDPDDVNDLVQDTYLKVCLNSHYYKADTNLKAWAYTIMKNTFINQYKRKQRIKNTVTQTDNLAYQYEYVTNPSDNADMKVWMSEINTAISKQPDKQRKPLEMFIEGHKYHEIADAMNLSIGTVKSRIFFARKKIMEELKDY
jgi:RNA polymerase sigma-70 factor (ECF subfamily)